MEVAFATFAVDGQLRYSGVLFQSEAIGFAFYTVPEFALLAISAIDTAKLCHLGDGTGLLRLMRGI